MTALLDVQALTVTFDTGVTVGPLSLRRDTGIVWLRGPNGSGKSTLLRCLCGERPATTGQVRINGEDPFATPSARARVSLVKTTPELPDYLTVDEAWRMMASLRGQRHWRGEALRDALDLPGGLALRHASSGQRRRAELVAALAGDPDILLMDEVFTTLDTSGAALLAEWLEDWRNKRLVVITSHTPLPITADEQVNLTPSG
jgi:ABC-2 type transport system ATP-binding protein